MKTIRLLTPEVDAMLDRLSRLFVWRRKPLAQEIQMHLVLADNAHDALRARHQRVRFKAIALRKRLHDETDRASSLQSSLTDTQSTLANTKSALAATQSTLLNMESALTDTQSTLANTESVLEDTQSKLTNLEAAFSEVRERYDLVANLLAATPANANGLDQFRKALNEDYLAFAGAESSLADEARAYRMLQAVEEQLEVIANEPDIYAKKIIAIAGGFSSGKSEFVNSFITASEIKLAVGIRPVTAIPTYVRQASATAIKAHAKTGGAIEMKAALYEKISHDFLKTLGFDLKKIMPFMSIATPMPDACFDNLCLIDTPGYNPPRTAGYTAADLDTASTFATQGDAIIWVIGLDSTGTLVSSDLEFIQRLDLAGKELYVVANKADLRGLSDIEDILDDIGNVLADEGIPFAGISAYSSREAREFGCRRESLQAFLSRHNETVVAGAKLYDTIDRVFDMYRSAIARDIADSVRAQRTFKSMSLDLQQHASDELINALEQRFASLRHENRESELRGHLKAAWQIKAKLKAAVYGTLSAAGAHARGEAMGIEDFEDPLFEDVDDLIASLMAQETTLKENEASEEAQKSSIGKESPDRARDMAPKPTSWFDGIFGRLAKVVTQATETSEPAKSAQPSKALRPDSPWPSPQC